MRGTDKVATRPTIARIRSGELEAYANVSPKELCAITREPIGQPYFYLESQEDPSELHAYSAEGLMGWLRKGGLIDPETGLPWGDPYGGQILPVHTSRGQTLRTLQPPERPADKPQRFIYGTVPAHARIVQQLAYVLQRSPGLLDGWSHIQLEHLNALFHGEAAGMPFLSLARPPPGMSHRLALLSMQMVVSELLRRNDAVHVREFMDFRFRITAEGEPSTLQLSMHEGAVGFGYV